MLQHADTILQLAVVGILATAVLMQSRSQGNLHETRDMLGDLRDVLRDMRELIGEFRSEMRDLRSEVNTMRQAKAERN